MRASSLTGISGTNDSIDEGGPNSKRPVPHTQVFTKKRISIQNVMPPSHNRGLTLHNMSPDRVHDKPFKQEFKSERTVLVE